MTFVLNDSNTVSWKDLPFPGISHKFLKIGEDACVDLTRIESGAALPPHRHFVRQRSFFVSGVGRGLDETPLPVGSYAEVPPGARHGTRAIEEVVILNVFDGLVTWLLDDGQVFVLTREGRLEGLGKVNEFGPKRLPY